MKYGICFLLAVVVGSAALLAGEGRIPIYLDGVTTISESGSYILTRKLGSSGKPSIAGIHILNTSGVDIDLNGFTISSVQDPVIYAQDVQKLRIHNGAIWANENAIALVNVQSFELRRLLITGTEDDCTVDASGTGVIEDNQIRNVDQTALCTSGNIQTRNNLLIDGPLATQSSEQ